jgi:hypothetical protein
VSAARRDIGAAHAARYFVITIGDHWRLPEAMPCEASRAAVVLSLAAGVDPLAVALLGLTSALADATGSPAAAIQSPAASVLRIELEETARDMGTSYSLGH